MYTHCKNENNPNASVDFIEKTLWMLFQVLALCVCGNAQCNSVNGNVVVRLRTSCFYVNCILPAIDKKQMSADVI